MEEGALAPSPSFAENMAPENGRSMPHAPAERAIHRLKNRLEGKGQKVAREGRR